MFKFFPKIILALIFWGIFVGVMFNVPYPESLTSATLSQILPFFTSLFLVFVFTFNFLIRSVIISSIFSLGLILLFFLKALDSLNLVTGILILISTFLLISYFKKAKKHTLLKNSGFRNLTKQTKIPRLTRLRKEN